jgi:glycosyltransferase involved in cell wall biosynthesis
MTPLLSVCIPAYNRAEVLDDLLQSVLAQSFDGYEIVICEDASPQRGAIRAVVERLPAAARARIRYFENETNLGYDANLRNVIARAAGEYCLLMGNDDLLCPGALETVTNGLARHPGSGVVLRTYASFDDDPTVINQVFRYFDQERVFQPGRASIVTFFRRSVVLPGLCLRRAAAVSYATDEFDGTLLYQLYLVGRIMAVEPGLFLPEVITLYRNGGIPDFGNSAAERGKFVPGVIVPEASLHFMESMLRIARTLQERCGVAVYQPIVRDLANYSYPFIAIQAWRPWRVFVRYCWRLARLGFGRYPLFYVYILSLVTLGSRRVEAAIRYVKKKLGRTPVLGSVHRGHAV